MQTPRLHSVIAVLFAGLWGGFVYATHASGHMHFLDRLEATLTDLRTVFRGPKPAPDLVTIVAIDDAVVKRGHSYPLSRSELAEIVDAVAKQGPKLIAIDLLLVDRGPADGDAALAKALTGRPVVLAAAAIFSDARETVATAKAGPLAALPPAERFLEPLPAFAAQAEVGVVNVATGQSGSPLSIPMLFRSRDKVELSLPLRVAARALGARLTIAPDHLMLGDRAVPIDSDFGLPITYYGPRRTIRTVSAESVFDGTLDGAAIKDRIVIIGAAVAGGGDFFPTAFDPLLPGVEVISTAVTHLLAGDGIVRNHNVHVVDAILAIVLPMGLVGLLAWRRSAIGLLTAAAIVAAWATSNFFAFDHGVWLSAAIPFAAIVPPVAIFGAVQLWAGGRTAQYLTAKSDSLAQFQSPAMQRWLSQDPDFLTIPVHQKAAVVFIDLSGFTALSERLDPERLRDLLQELHALIDTEAIRSSGTITGFLGDGAMILFGLPKPMSDDAARAIRCCVGLHQRLERWLASLPHEIGDQIGFKIGAHFGPIVASRLGASHAHITATGDTVNVANRLMEVAASHRTRLALSDTLIEAAGLPGGPLAEGLLIGPLLTRLRGRSAPLNVWLWRSEAEPTRIAAKSGAAS
jgi:adenylate cyclase